MKLGIFMTEYHGFYAVHFSNRSAGLLLFSTYDKDEAERELNRYKAMTGEELQAHILNQ